MKTEIILAIDYGTKHCGLAYSPNSENVFPLEVVLLDHLESKVADLITEKQISKVVIGWPQSTDGTDGPLAQDIRALKRRLVRLFGVPVELVDERFSSKEVVTSTPNKRIDDLAAGQILSYYLARLD